MTPAREGHEVSRGDLDRERSATRDRLAALVATFEDMVRSADTANIDDEHDPEGVTVAFERAQISGLIDNAQRHLDALDAATARMDAGTYGRCAGCGNPIGAERLGALPSTELCIECADARR
ncbi:MAG: TraR/DksA C4-type zinc finger protein [Acidimicrobiia bacterium]